jgi:hypothetical protein
VLGGLPGSANEFCATLNLEDVVLQVNGVEAVLNCMRDGFAASSETRNLNEPEALANLSLSALRNSDQGLLKSYEPMNFRWQCDALESCQMILITDHAG